jgi:IstB-like ATP binding protein
MRKRTYSLSGPPGTGRSHVAKAFALLAVQRGYTVLFREAHQLIQDLAEARELGPGAISSTHLGRPRRFWVARAYVARLDQPSHGRYTCLGNEYQEASTHPAR